MWTRKGTEEPLYSSEASRILPFPKIVPNNPTQPFVVVPAMNEGSGPNQSLIDRIEELERERDELKKDLEQLCLHQAGPGLLGVATRLHLQRTAGLEQEINTLKKKIATLTRENQNLHEELSEAYRIKGQLADLYSAEVCKNNEIEKQVKFFQGCIATAFAERDHALMESEKAKEHEEAILQDLNVTRDRIEEIESTCAELWRDNASLQTELLTIKEKIVPFEKVVSKFYDIRQTATGHVCDSWDEKCACLLNDPNEMWSFDEDRNSSTSQYIASLEENLAATKFSVENLQSKIRMGLEIEHHLSRKARSLEKKLVDSFNIARDGIMKLRNFHIHIRTEIMSMLQMENDEIKSILSKLEHVLNSACQPDKMVTASEQQNNDQILDDRIIGTEHEAFQEEEEHEIQTEGKEHDDLNISYNDESTAIANASASGRTVISNNNLESSDALALALQEKVDALLLLSQQEERHLLVRDLNAALQLKIGELQSNLLRVTHEKVTTLVELADLKQKLQQQQQNCNCGMKHGLSLADSSSRDISSQMRDGRLKDLLKKTYLARWVGKGVTGNEVLSPSNPKVSVTDNEENLLLDTSRSTVETTTLQDSIINMEDCTSSIRNLHMSLSKLRNDVSASMSNNVLDLLDGIILEGERIKAALGASLPVSSSSVTGENDVAYVKSSQATVMFNEKPDALSAALLEMSALLILLASLLKESARLRTSTNEAEAEKKSKSDEI